jgi:hydroxypyruvate isomerase
VKPVETVTGEMWLAAEKTLTRIARLGEREGVTFVLENLNTAVDHPERPSPKRRTVSRWSRRSTALH